MKFLKNILLFAAVMGFASSCDSDIDTLQIATPEKFVAPVINNCNDVIVNLDNVKAETVVFSWSKADFGLPVQVLYSLYLTDGTNNALVGTTSNTQLAVSKSDVNGAVINGLGVAANATASVKAFVTAEVNGTDKYEALTSNSSNSFNVTTFEAPLGVLYLCGEFNGSWDIDNAPVFYETTGGSNIYKCMVDFSKAADGDDATRSYFKVVAQQNWSGDNWGYNALKPSWTCPEQKDSNLSLPFSEGSIFELTVNRALMTIDKNAIGNTLGLIGKFNDWGGDEFFTYDYKSSTWKTAPVALTAGDEVKIRVNSDWGTNWGDAGSVSTAISGGTELKIGGGNIKVPASGTFVVTLHANRTPYVLEFVAQ